mgnify:CR=1 FL=1
MEFVIPKSDLVRELQTVTGIVEKRSTLAILANLLLEAGGGKVRMGASDLEVTVRGSVEAEVRKEGGVTLPAAKLHEIARSLPDADVQFKLMDRNQVAISCERVRYRIAGQPKEDFPKFPDIDFSKGLRLPGAALREMIRRVAFAITTEDPRYSKEYHDPDKRSIANAVQVFFTDGTSTPKVEVEYPIGHRRRRAEGIPVLERKFLDALRTRFPKGQAQGIYDLCLDAERLAGTAVHEFVDRFVI